jgi:hypothetical protein
MVSAVNTRGESRMGLYGRSEQIENLGISRYRVAWVLCRSVKGVKRIGHPRNELVLRTLASK